MYGKPTDDFRRPYPADTNYSVTRDGRVFRDVKIGRAKARELTLHDSVRGYLQVCFNGRLWNVHQMVARTFLPNPENKPEVAHNNGNKLDNNVENLRWATRKENSADMALHGTKMFGEKHPSSILSESEVVEIRKLVVGKRPRQRPYHRDIAKQFGVTRECVTRIANGDRWAHVTG